MLAQTQKRQGIGEGERTMKDLLEESTRLYQETGYWAGLKELKLAKQDPVKLELFQSRMLAAVVAGREAYKMVSANFFVREVGELCTALNTPDGYVLAYSTGLPCHVPLMAAQIRNMILNDYEDDPGINDGDVFTSNEPTMGAMHPNDIYDMMPIFYNGELVSWASTIIMEPEVGGVSPGSQPPNSTERFTDGFRVVCEKTAQNFKLRKEFLTRIRYETRGPDAIILDRKGTLAANFQVRQEVLRTIDEFGIEYFRQALRELIELERRNHIARIKTRLVPGRLRNVHAAEQYQTRLPVSALFQKDEIILQPLELRIEPSGKCTMDHDGAGPWGWHNANISPDQMMGLMALVITRTMAYTGAANHGTLLNYELNNPPGTVVNPSSMHISTRGSFGFGLVAGPLYIGLQSRALFARGFREETQAGGGSCPVTEWSGKSHLGVEPYATVSGQLAGSMGSGAFGVRDGLDTAYNLAIPEPDLGNIEVWELLHQAVYTGWEITPDLCGYGRYRSGLSLFFQAMVYKTDRLIMAVAPFDNMEKLVSNRGLFGGYPGPVAFWGYVRGANTKELIEQRKPLPYKLGDPLEPDAKKMLDGEFVLMSATSAITKDLLKDGDWVFHSSQTANGGIGDPITRDPKLAKADLDNGLATPEFCRKMYCIEATYDSEAKEWKIDAKRTAELREARRKERLERGVPAKEWWQKARQRVLNGELPPMIKEMYNGSLAKGTRWTQEYRDFWRMPQDFTFLEARQ